MTGAAITAVLALGVLAISAWLHINGKDGGGWGVLAVILIMVSCSRAGG